MVILLYSVSATLPPQLPSFSQSFFFLLFFVVEAIFPRLIQQINSAFWLLTKRKKEKKNTFNICNTCPSSFNCGIQCLFNRLLAALSCWSKQPHKAANYSINFPTLRRSQGWRTRGDCNQRRFGGGKLTNGDTRGTGLCTFLVSSKTNTSPKNKQKMSGGVTMQGVKTPRAPSTFSSSRRNSRSRVSECFKIRCAQHFIDFTKCTFLYTF